MTIYYINGEFTEHDEVRLSIDDRGYYFGDGVYEVMKVYNGQLFTAPEHIERLFQSAAKIKMPLAQSAEDILQIAEQLLQKNNIVTGHIYMQITRGAAPRAHQFPLNTQPILTAYALESPRPADKMETGIAAKSVDDFRWLRCDIKSLNLLANVMAKQEAYDANCGEAIFHRDGVITEGSSTNVFGVLNGTLYTHPANNLILNGITRRVVLELCTQLDLKIVEEPISLQQAFNMDELFVTSTTLEIMPVTVLDGKQISEGQPGQLTKKLQEAFAGRIQQPAMNL